MFGELIKLPNSSEENVTKKLLPAILLCAGTLNISVTEVGIIEIIANPGYSFTDSRIAVVRHIAERLYRIYTAKQTYFRLDAQTLMQDAVRLYWCQENSFFSESIWVQECRYLVPAPISETSSLSDLLVPLIAWKNFGFQFRHAVPLGTALLLATSARLATADERLREQLFLLLQTLAIAPAWELEMAVYGKVQEIFSRRDEKK